MNGWWDHQECYGYASGASGDYVSSNGKEWPGQHDAARYSNPRAQWSSAVAWTDHHNASSLPQPTYSINSGKDNQGTQWWSWMEHDDASPPLEPTHSNIFVGGVPSDMNQNQLRRVFEKYGRMRSVKIIHSKKGTYAFIKFDSVTQAVRAVEQMTGHGLFRVTHAEKDSKEFDQLVEGRADIQWRDAKNWYGTVEPGSPQHHIGYEADDWYKDAGNSKGQSWDSSDDMHQYWNCTGKRFSGTVVSYNANNGFGFIECPGLLEKKDVFLHWTHVKHFVVGDRVNFYVHWSKQGQPQANDLHADYEGDATTEAGDTNSSPRKTRWTPGSSGVVLMPNYACSDDGDDDNDGGGATWPSHSWSSVHDESCLTDSLWAMHSPALADGGKNWARPVYSDFSKKQWNSSSSGTEERVTWTWESYVMTAFRSLDGRWKGHDMWGQQQWYELILEPSDDDSELTRLLCRTWTEGTAEEQRKIVHYQDGDIVFGDDTQIYLDKVGSSDAVWKDWARPESKWIWTRGWI
eukprot:gnl/MRDRNA2_/MRDRNA2_66386_c0_seq1.p1 gnl/MRDRNA2_/MRDRNA2_66386_c0~~gnl/MRDRNA2_/MRDRNA2_66386_c0_seq1.p1  ORF type:complete len:518 (+),score=80.33 gnl/MRDRNA2_/MRDRNA2_66386_c0_seq1:81-1634(+)